MDKMILVTDKSILADLKVHAENTRILISNLTTETDFDSTLVALLNNQLQDIEQVIRMSELVDDQSISPEIQQEQNERLEKLLQRKRDREMNYRPETEE